MDSAFKPQRGSALFGVSGGWPSVPCGAGAGSLEDSALHISNWTLKPEVGT